MLSEYDLIEIEKRAEFLIDDPTVALAEMREQWGMEGCTKKEARHWAEEEFEERLEAIHKDLTMLVEFVRQMVEFVRRNATVQSPVSQQALRAGAQGGQSAC